MGTFGMQLGCGVLQCWHVERVEQVLVRVLEVQTLVARAHRGGVEETESLCRGEGEMVRT